MTAHPLARVPGSIGAYRLEGRLGRGGMGEVWAGYDTRLDRQVALKRVRPGTEDPEKARRRFRREARAAARLQHPAVVQVFDWVETEDGDWIVMELVDGRSLRSVLREGRLEPGRSAHLSRDLLAGLGAAHAAGVVHRDLKAENVMVVPVASPRPGEGVERARILDFGLARSFGHAAGESAAGESQISEEKDLVGTVSAMSPEQVLGRTVDHRSDLFSMGSLLYEMTTGVSPFRADSPAETLQRVCTSKPRPARALSPAVPEALSAFIDHLLEKDPRWRPKDAGEALDQLDGLLADLPPEATPEIVRKGESGTDGVSSSAFTTLVSSRITGHFPMPAPRRWIGPALVAIVGAWAVFGVLRPREPATAPPPEEIYVAVPTTRIVTSSTQASPDPDLELAASAIRTALLRGLLGFQHFVALEPSADEAADPAELVRALAADEVLTSQLECDARACQVVLKRYRGRDGAVLRTRGFSVETRHLLELSFAVLEHLRGAYPDAEPRRGVPDLEVRSEDYEAYLRLRRRFDHREDGFSADDLLAELEGLEHGSPRFLPLPLFEVRLLVRRFQEERDPTHLERAEEILARARARAPEDPRVLSEQARVALAGGHLDEAAAAVERLRRLEPGDALQMFQQALLLERRGDEEEALALLRQAARRLPSLEFLVRLADMAYRQGDVETARRSLETALERSPEHYNSLSRLAQLELLSGDPERAAELYENLVSRSAESTELGNLGTAYLLLGRWDEAAQRFREAFELAPKSPFVALNLADALLLLGRTEEASALYETVLELTENDPDPESLLTVRAQALAHLGRPREAGAAVREALRLAPDNPQVLYEAALVHVLIGDEAAALDNAASALGQGVEPRWFTFPWFDPLREQIADIVSGQG